MEGKSLESERAAPYRLPQRRNSSLRRRTGFALLGGLESLLSYSSAMSGLVILLRIHDAPWASPGTPVARCEQNHWREEPPSSSNAALVRRSIREGPSGAGASRSRSGIEKSLARRMRSRSNRHWQRERGGNSPAGGLVAGRGGRGRTDDRLTPAYRAA